MRIVVTWNYWSRQIEFLCGSLDQRLSLFFLQKEGKDTTEEVKTPSNPVKQEELSVNQNPTEGSDETNPNESGKTETPVEQTSKEVIETVDVSPTTSFAFLLL